MRVAIDVRSLMEGRFSGVEQYTIQIIRGLLRVAPRHTYKLFYNAARPVDLPDFYGDVEIIPFRYPNKLFNVSQWLLSRPRWDSLVEADVFFLPNSRLVPLVPTTPLVVVAHDVSFERFKEFFDVKRRIWHRMMAPKTLLHRADKVIAVSEHTKRDLMALYDLQGEDVSVVHSGVHIPAKVLPDDLLRVRGRYTLPDRFILYVGALEPRKNIATLIRAFDAIADQVPHDLVIAGEKGWLTYEVQRAWSLASYQHRIHIIGFIPEIDKMALYAAADLFVYPSFYEGFGFPPLEALLAGTPVVTSFNSSLPEVVGKWATLIDPYNGAEIAAVMKELLLDLPVVEERIQQDIINQYSWDRAALQTIKILEEAAGK